MYWELLTQCWSISCQWRCLLVATEGLERWQLLGWQQSSCSTHSSQPDEPRTSPNIYTDTQTHTQTHTHTHTHTHRQPWWHVSEVLTQPATSKTHTVQSTANNRSLNLICMFGHGRGLRGAQQRRGHARVMAYVAHVASVWAGGVAYLAHVASVWAGGVAYGGQPKPQLHAVRLWFHKIQTRLVVKGYK